MSYPTAPVTGALLMVIAAVHGAAQSPGHNTYANPIDIAKQLAYRASTLSSAVPIR